MKTESYILQYRAHGRDWLDTLTLPNLDDLTVEAVRRCEAGNKKFDYRIIMRTDNVIVNENVVARAAK